jgi:hypothetical protein
MPKTESHEGDTKQCFTCKGIMYYRMKPSDGKYAAKLQWQNEDGTAHFGFDQNTQKAYCKTNAPKIERATRIGESVQSSGEIHLKDIDLSIEELDVIANETNKLLKYQLARIFYIQEGLKKAGLNPTGPFVGMLYNQQMESLRNAV